MKNRDWPAWYYGPDGAAAIFHKPEDVPKGWEDHPKKVADPSKPPEPVKNTIPLSRKEIIERLRASNIPFKHSDSTAHLYNTLKAVEIEA